MTSIYSIQDWLQSTQYYQYDVVYRFSKYYYAKRDIDANTPFDFSDWGGFSTYGNESKPEFIWRPDYNSLTNHVPRVKSIQFGDGYEQRASDGIYNQLLEFDLDFNLRSLREAHAILHFFYARNGTESFFFTPNAPYAIRKKFTCREWQHNEVYADNHSIKAKIKESIT